MLIFIFKEYIGNNEEVGKNPLMEWLLHELNMLMKLNFKNCPTICYRVLVFQHRMGDYFRVVEVFLVY
jgi:hypothetical protein